MKIKKILEEQDEVEAIVSNKILLIKDNIPYTIHKFLTGEYDVEYKDMDFINYMKQNYKKMKTCVEDLNLYETDDALYIGSGTRVIVTQNSTGPKISYKGFSIQFFNFAKLHHYVREIES